MIDCKFQRNTDGFWQCQNENCGWIYKRKSDKPPRRNCRPETPEEKARRQWLSKHGVGFHLHRLIESWTGEKITKGCLCKIQINRLNQQGPAHTRDNLDSVIDDLITEIDRRLEKAESKPSWALRFGGMDLPGRRFALKRLVLVAVRRAERELKAIS